MRKSIIFLQSVQAPHDEGLGKLMWACPLCFACFIAFEKPLYDLYNVAGDKCRRAEIARNFYDALGVAAALCAFVRKIVEQ